MIQAQVPVGVSLTDDSPPASDPPPKPVPWLWPVVVAVALGPFVLTAVGVVAVKLHPLLWPTAPPVALAELPSEPEPSVPVVEPPPTPEPVEPGEARPPLPGLRPAPEQPAPVVTVVRDTEPVKIAATKGPRCERFGTAIDFVRSPALACDRAAREQKLVMVLHVAGYFDDPGFT
jgi:hypothetical protein